MDGILLINKPPQMTSFGVVARVRRRLSEEAGKKVKVGHTGTLDPFATGLMILVIGKACREAGRFSKLDKTYEATIKLGEVSSTGDPEGEITSVSKVVPDLDEVTKAAASFVGEIQQTPPQFSAIKINGQRAYKLARKGEKVEIPVRTVTIYSLAVTGYEYPYLTISTHVSSGTYIRTLAEDIGATLGTGAYVTALHRGSIHDYSVDKAIMIEEVEAEKILPLTANN